MTDSQKMELLFANERATKANLTRVAFWLATWLARARAYVYNGDKTYWSDNATYNAWRTGYEDVRLKYIKLANAYNTRNAAYRKQPQSYWKIADDSISKAFDSVFNSLKSVLGISGGVGADSTFSTLATALSWLGGPIVALITAYFTSSSTDASGAKSLAEKLADTDPETAIKMAEIASKEAIAMKKTEEGSGIMAQIGKGIKTVVILGGSLVIIRYGVLPMIGSGALKKAKRKISR